MALAPETETPAVAGRICFLVGHARIILTWNKPNLSRSAFKRVVKSTKTLLILQYAVKIAG